jgi:hypothetical protein
MVEMPKSKAKPPQVDPLAGVNTDRPFPRLGLSAAQWNEICRLSGIPDGADEARNSIEIALGMFRQFQATDLHRMPLAKIRQEFDALADDSRSLYKRLSDLVRNRDAYTALIGHVPYTPLDRMSDTEDHQASLSSAESQRPIQDEQHLIQILDVLVGLPKWLLIGSRRVRPEKRGPKARNVYWLVGNLDGIRKQFAGKQISRSYKDDASKKYITYVCRIADPHIGDGTIDKAMKNRIQRSRTKRRPVD